MQYDVGKSYEKKENMCRRPTSEKVEKVQAAVELLHSAEK